MPRSPTLHRKISISETSGTSLATPHTIVGNSILLVDDEQVVQRVLRYGLEREGYTVFVASGYEEALRTYLLRKHEIALLITDVALPDKNGLELARFLVAETPDMRVLFISGWTGAELLQRYQIEDIERYFLPKPFKIQDLISAVQKALHSESPNLYRTAERVMQAS